MHLWMRLDRLGETGMKMGGLGIQVGVSVNRLSIQVWMSMNNTTKQRVYLTRLVANSYQDYEDKSSNVPDAFIHFHLFLLTSFQRFKARISSLSKHALIVRFTRKRFLKKLIRH